MDRGLRASVAWEGPLVRGLSATVDWYKITMEDVIEPYSVDYARYLCYGTKIVTNDAEAAAQAATRAAPERAAWRGSDPAVVRSRSC